MLIANSISSPPAITIGSTLLELAPESRNKAAPTLLPLVVPVSSCIWPGRLATSEVICPTVAPVPALVPCQPYSPNQLTVVLFAKKSSAMLYPQVRPTGSLQNRQAAS